MPVADPSRPFNLLRWFAWLSPVVIALTAVASAWQMSSFLNDHLFQREATVSRDFLQNVLLSDGSLEYLARPQDQDLASRFGNTTSHLSNMRDVLRTNVFGRDRSILWSSDPTLKGRSFADNEELDEALQGQLVVHAGRIAADAWQKAEHVGLDRSVEFFVETYIPVVRPGSGEVIGVVELYKAPLALTQAIQEGRMRAGLSALAGALFLYLSLFWLVRRADTTIKRQHAQLVETETLAAIGELASAVAHNIRNPLASIRSAAELALESPHEDCSEQTRDIMREVDRISQRINELLRFSGKERAQSETFDLGLMLQQGLADYEATFCARQQTLTLELRGCAALVRADPVMLQQVFHSILSNAAEAMPAGGACAIVLDDAGAAGVRVQVIDSGTPASPDVVRLAFRPFFTTKPQGLGLGLPLARRIVERFGGTLTLHGGEHGSTVTLTLPRV